MDEIPSFVKSKSVSNLLDFSQSLNEEEILKLRMQKIKDELQSSGHFNNANFGQDKVRLRSAKPKSFKV